MLISKGEVAMKRRGASEKDLDNAVAAINRGKKIVMDAASGKEREEHELEISKALESMIFLSSFWKLTIEL